MEQIGVSIGLRDDIELVQRAEELGYHSIWTGEGQGRTGFGKLERWAAHTDRIRLATGIVNIYSRSPATIAQATATLDSHAAGRAILGLGVAHPGVVEEFHGMEYERPISRMHEYIELVRRYLGGADGAYDGDFFTPERTTLWDAYIVERESVPIYNAALGKANVRLTGAVADGWFPYLLPLEDFERARSWLEAGAQKAGRDPESVDIVMYLLAAVDKDPTVAKDAARHHIATYLRDIPGYYARVASDAGFEDDVRGVRAAATTEAGADAISEEFLDAVSVAGTPDDVREQVATIRDSGVDMPVIRAPLSSDRAGIERLLETLAPA